MAAIRSSNLVKFSLVAVSVDHFFKKSQFGKEKEVATRHGSGRRFCLMSLPESWHKVNATLNIRATLSNMTGQVIIYQSDISVNPLQREGFVISFRLFRGCATALSHRLLASAEHGFHFGTHGNLVIPHFDNLTLV